MPLNIRAKPSQSKLSAGPKSSGHTDGSASHSRFSKTPKHGKGKQAPSSAPGSRSGLEPGSVSGGLPAPVSKLTESQGSMSRPGSKIKAATAAHKGASHGSATAPGGKTLSMENIQSLSAAYATSGTMYPSERDSLEPSAGYPKGTMTLGRSTIRSSYTGRTTAMGSSPNITSSGLHHQSDPYGDQSLFSAGTSSLRRQSGKQPQVLDLSGRGEVSTFDLQAQLRELQRENDNLRRELDGGRTGPSNSVNFWSPDVKKDKGVRREEGVRTSVLKDQYRTNHEDLQVRKLTQTLPFIHELQEELRAHREMNSRLQQQSPCQVPGCDGFSSPPPLDLSEENFFQLQSEHERQAKELNLLRKTMEDMEMRIDSQKQTLGARDESIQRLLEMLQGQGQGNWGRGQRTGIITMAAQEAEAQLESMHVREELHRRNQLQADPAKTRALQTVIDMKDTKISSLERNIRDLEDEVQMLKTSGLLHPDDRQDELKQVEVYKSHSKFMKTKAEQMKQELNRKESEMQALQTKLETLTNQNSDCKQHIEVLKESLSAKEQRANTLQTEVDALRVRLEEKEQLLTKKTKQLQDLTDEKSTLTGEIRDMKDMLDVKERKVNVLQKKIENLLEQLKDKDKQLAGLRERVQGLQTDSSNTDTALATLEEALSEKERVIENLREEKEREDRVRLEELELMKKENQELKDKLSSWQSQKLSQSQPTNPSLTQNQSAEQKAAQTNECCGKEVLNWSLNCSDITDRLRLLEQEVARYREESGKSQAEVERLMAALRDAEMDKTCKEKKIADLERQFPNLELEHFGQNLILRKLRFDNPNGTIHELMGALEKTRQELDATKLRLSSTQQSLHERDGHLNSLRQERRKQLEEILEMKQQALLAAISEKDANIALLELSSSKRKKAQEEVMALKREKDRLMHQLKQQTQSRMKLIADNYEEELIHPQHHPHYTHHLHPSNLHHRSLPRGPPHANHRPPMDQVSIRFWMDTLGIST
uniref:ELKS/RAB6-interacting/CAST family member 2 n=1 Tax=Mastacembelus armatus TaxID=205130 RepID=A0A3Q3LY70_9TELE